MIKDLLDATMLDALQYTTISQRTRDLPMLNELLQECKYAKDVLPILKYELLSRNRDSYIFRIYGRYRKLLPKTDMPALQEWRVSHWEKPKE